ncbi:hypothetical protein PCE1_003814 [Barthelona sp. PCE]
MPIFGRPTRGLRAQSQFRQSKKGRIVRESRPIIRRNVLCSVQECNECFQEESKLSLEKPILVMSSNVCVSHFSVIEFLARRKHNVVLPQSNLSAFLKNSVLNQRKLQNLLKGWTFDSSETKQEQTTVHYFPDRAARFVATDLLNTGSIGHSVVRFYNDHVDAKAIYIVSDTDSDAANSERNGVTTVSLREYVLQHEPDLGCLVEDVMESATLFDEHWSDSEMNAAIANKKAFRGVFHADKYSPISGSIRSHSFKDNITVEKGKFNRATNRDIVCFTVEDDKATIRGIMIRNWRDYCGSVEQDGIFHPVDRHMPSFNLRTSDVESLMGQRILVKLVDWPATAELPTAHFFKVIGPMGDRNVETRVILIENEVPHYPFSESILACLPSSPWVPTAVDKKGRADFRDKPICSIDPPGCKDIDDALHCIQTGPLSFEVGVHIADVSHFVRPNCAMDMEARKRATSVYLVDRRIDMLPKMLTEDLCSLRCKVDRFAFSVIWQLTLVEDEERPSGYKIQYGNVQFTKSIIHSQASLTYGKALEIMNTKSREDDMAQSIRGLWKIAQLLKEQRLIDGALVLASTAVKFEVDEVTREPLSVKEYIQGETHSLVEEFMLLANRFVAKKIFDEFPSTALLRRHPAPREDKIEELNESLQLFGVTINAESNKTLAESLRSAVSNEHGSTERERDLFLKYLKIRVTRCMSLAKYFVTGQFSEADFEHYGLAVSYYTHFTSPIRRYSDLVVHRLLAACTDFDELPPDMLVKDQMAAICDNLNKRKFIADRSGRMSDSVSSLLLIRGRPIKAVGVVVNVLPNGVRLHFPAYGVEGFQEFSINMSDATLPQARPVDGGFVVSQDGKEGPVLLFKSYVAEISVSVEEKSYSMNAQVRLLPFESIDIMQHQPRPAVEAGIVVKEHPKKLQKTE